MTAKLRCAIYTRKSSEEGLDQEYNSLHAQRDACEAYIRSQVGEGWLALKTAYDDGGFSGGSMDRPALRTLMADIEQGRVDVVVVYKVDRLTRSLMDFARIVETFDRKGVSFVSVTQAFNTTSSMGRLTLNVLLSFAQFEREVTGERIRDKIAASKAKGMWMGGNLPLGYDAVDRKLVVNPAESEQVRRLFQRCLDLGSVHALLLELGREGVTSKRWETRAGAVRGGEPFSRGALFYLLKNRLYIGEIPHKTVSYPGLHVGIVDPEIFHAVQAQLLANARKHQGRTTRSSGAPLRGLLFDQQGQPMTPTFSTGKGGRTFRYYVSTNLQQGEKSAADDAVRRISAPQLEALIADHCSALAGVSGSDPWADIGQRLRRVELKAQTIELVFDDGAELETCRDDQTTITRDGDGRSRMTLRVRPVLRGGRTWLLNPNTNRTGSEPRVDPGLVAALRRAHQLLAEHRASPEAPNETLLDVVGPADSYSRNLMNLAFLAPDIQAAILAGCQPPGLSAQQIVARTIPLEWAAQRERFGFPC
jgi:site-specific DNA recombinase